MTHKDKRSIEEAFERKESDIEGKNDFTETGKSKPISNKDIPLGYSDAKTKRHTRLQNR